MQDKMPKMQESPAKSGTVGKFAMYSAEVLSMIKFVSLINHKLQ